MKTPFEIGELYFLPKHNITSVQIPCFVCAGKKVVRVIDGYDVEWNVACEACGLGYEGSRGWVNEDSYEPMAKPFTIKEVIHFSSPESWSLVSKEGDCASWNMLKRSQQDALQCSREFLERIIEENHRRTASQKKLILQKKTWTLRYHRKCLDRFERQKDYHNRRIQHIQTKEVA